MGAVPERDDRAAVSPLREFESRTESVTGISEKPGPRRFARVPTHTIGVASERRRYPRASLSLPLRLTRIGDSVEPFPVTLVTRNISSSGVSFLAPRDIEPFLPWKLSRDIRAKLCLRSPEQQPDTS